MTIAKLILEYIEALVWPGVVLYVSCSYREEVLQLLTRMTKASLPGGVSLDFATEARQAEKLSREVTAAPLKPEDKARPSIPLTEANARLLSLELQPSPSGLNMEYYRELAQQDPNIALAGLRIEVDVLARNLAKGFGLEVNSRDSNTSLLRTLRSQGAITSGQFELAIDVVKLCNAAIHGTRVSLTDADNVIDAAKVLTQQYLSWLSWGFDDDWTPGSQR